MLINKIKSFFSAKENKPIESTPEKSGFMFSTDIRPHTEYLDVLGNTLSRAFQKTSKDFISSGPDKAVMDSAIKSTMDSIAPNRYSYGNIVPIAQLDWYGSQSFIGYQMAAILSQHWLIYKCCEMPAEDAVRNGYEITVNDGSDVDPEILDEMRKLDVKYNVNEQMVNMITQGRIFGIRVVIFKVDSSDPLYYEKPFNPDGIKPGSYRGIVQVDPYWITPELDLESSANPASDYFYIPTWWRVNGKRYHRTHLIVFTTGEIPDILKPTYIFGGVPIPQKIYERVYAAERIANEAPQLALSKRTTLYKTDLAQVQSKRKAFEENLQTWAANWNNYGIKVCDKESEDMQQFDTSLSDFDAVIMSQYQIVAAIANVPAVKLLGTSPKGFNASGNYEEKSYHEELKSIQAHNLGPFLERHHLLVIRSEIVPQFGVAPFQATVVWNPLNEVSAEEQAVLNKTKAETGQILIASGAIDGEDERNRIVNDPTSGYTGVSTDMPEQELEAVQSDPEDAE